MEEHNRSKPKNRKTPLQVAFGKLLKAKRQELGHSQEKLADLAGLHFTYVSSVERGERNISLENMAKIAEALGCNIRDLVDGLNP